MEPIASIVWAVFDTTIKYSNFVKKENESKNDCHYFVNQCNAKVQFKLLQSRKNGVFWHFSTILALFEGQNDQNNNFLILGKYFLSVLWFTFWPKLGMTVICHKNLFWLFTAIFGSLWEPKPPKNIFYMFVTILRPIVAKK